MKLMNFVKVNEMAVMKYNSPKLELRWVNIRGEGKPNMNGRMQYLATAVVPADSEALEKLRADINSFWEDNKPKAWKGKPSSTGLSPIEPMLDDEGEPQFDDEGKKVYDPDGAYGLVYKTGVSYKDGKNKKVRVFNAKAKEVELGDRQIGNGSVGVLGGSMAIYTVTDPTGKKIAKSGVTFYLDSVQLSKFVAYTGADPGFTADEDEEGFSDFDDDFGSAEDAGTEATGDKVRL